MRASRPVRWQCFHPRAVEVTTVRASSTFQAAPMQPRLPVRLAVKSARPAFLTLLLAVVASGPPFSLAPAQAATGLVAG